MGVPDIRCKENKVCFKFVNEHKFFLLLKICNFRNFYKTVQIMNTEEDNNRQGKLNTPT